MKVLRKLSLGCILYRYFITRNTQKSIKISEADFLTINHDDVLFIIAHLKDNQTSELCIGAYIATLNFLKDYIAEFDRSDVEFALVFENEKLLDPINIKL